MAIVDEFVTILGLEADPNAQREGGKITAVMKNVKDFAIVAGAALTAASVAIGAWAKSTAEATDEAGKFADSVGVSFEALQELEFATRRSGGSADALRGDIAKLTASMSSPIPGQFNQELALLGVNTRTASGQLKTADQVLVDLAARFKGLSDVKAQQFGQRLGLSQSTIRLLQQGSDGIAALRKEARDLGGILPEDAKEVAADFNDSLTNVRFTLKGISDAAAIGVLPALTAANDKLTDFLQTNRDLIQSGIQTFVQGITEGFDRFFAILDNVVTLVNDFLGPLSGLTSEFNAVDAIATGVVATLSAIGLVVTIVAAKFAIIGAAIAATVIVIDDIVTAFQGGDSAIGRFLDTFQNRFPALYDAFRSFGSFLKDTFITTINAVGDAFAYLWENFVPDINVTDILNKLESFAASFGFGQPEGGAQTGTSVPVAPGITNNVTNQQQRGGDINVSQNISGAGNPAAVAAEAAGRIGALQQTTSPGLNAPVVG